MIASSSPALIYRVPSRVLSLKQFVTGNDLFALKYVFAIWGALSATLSVEEKNVLIQSILSFLIQSTQQCDHVVLKKWFEVANAGVDSLFLLTSRFDKIVTLLVQQITSSFITQGQSNASPAEESAESVSIEKVNESVLTRFFFLLGQLSLKLLQFVEETAVRAKKARHHFEETKGGKSRNGSDFQKISQADDYEDTIVESINKNGIVIKYYMLSV